MSKLSTLAALCGGHASGESSIDSVASSSGAVKPGSLFAAVPGARVHGASFASQAEAAGAVAIVTDPAGEQILANAGNELPRIVVENVAARLGEIAAHVYGRPANALRSFAVTGTNGKTTTAYMIDNVLSNLGRTPGLIGTIEIRIGGERIPASLTTPMPADLQAILAEFVARGGTDVVMEASSHALIQGRTDPIQFDCVGFTNLTQDHLDFHKTMDAYFEAKAVLFSARKAKNAVITVDDEWGKRLYERAARELTGTVWALAVHGELPAGYVGWQVLERVDGGVELVSTTGEKRGFSTTLPGGFNVANAALALLMVGASGVHIQDLPQRVDPTVPGRMEVISPSGPRVVVDFAHNTDALEKAMEALRPDTRGKLVVVTGAAGERDAGKRFAMGQAVARGADCVVITDDDPHGESPAAIRQAVLEGCQGQSAQVTEIADRGEAIAWAIEHADGCDTILIAGRGHETIQEVQGKQIFLDDRVEARSALAARGVSAIEEC